MGRRAEAEEAWRRAVETAKSGPVPDLLTLAEVAKARRREDSPQLTSPSTCTIAELHSQFVENSSLPVDGRVLELARRGLAHASGEQLVDELIAVGYLYVNTGNLQLAVEIFSKLNERRDDLVGSHLGLGSALALLGRLAEAIASFSSAIRINPTAAEAFKRRGQTRAAKELLQDAVQDLSRAVELAPRDADALFQRGVVFLKTRHFQRSLDDFLHAAALGEDSAQLYNSMGTAHGQLGNLEDSLEAYDKALQRDPNFVEALLNKGRIAKEGGLVDVALRSFEKAIKLDTGRRFPQVFLYRAQLWYASGRPLECIADSKRYISFDPKDIESLTLLGLSHHSLGDYHTALEFYNRVLEIDEGNYVWYLRQTALFYGRNLDSDFRVISPDSHVDSAIKDGLSKRSDWRVTMVGYQEASHRTLERVESCSHCPISSSTISTADDISIVMQLQCHGFLSNVRQRRMFGMASLECADILRKSASSLNWRTLYDLAVRWRQVSEPNDCVYWIDGFPDTAFNEGFGLTTPIQNGELKTFRYYCYFEKCLSVVKKILINTNGEFFSARSEKMNIAFQNLGMISNISSLDQLYSLIGQDFYVVTSCTSSVCNEIAEGTRITLLKSAVAGYEFTIRTPGTPERWRWYSKVLDAAFSEVVSSLQGTSLERIRYAAFQMFYYFVNFAPLSRGSAISAYIVLNAIMIVGGYYISSPIPEGIQLDWEAILAHRKEDFITFAIACITVTPFDFDRYFNDSGGLRTYRDLVIALRT